MRGMVWLNRVVDCGKRKAGPGPNVMAKTQEDRSWRMASTVVEQDLWTMDGQ